MEAFVPPDNMNDLPPVVDEPLQFIAAADCPEPSLQKRSPSLSLPGMMSPQASPLAKLESQMRFAAGDAGLWPS